MAINRTNALLAIITVVLGAVMTLFIPVKLNPEGVEFIKKHEAFSAYPYKDQGGVPTIGYGSTEYLNGDKVTMSDRPLSSGEAYYLLIRSLSKYEYSVHKSVKKSLTQSQYNALVSFTYNCGIVAFERSGLLRKVNHDPTDPLIIQEFYKWVYVKGKISRGLIYRREAEIELYFKEPYLFPESQQSFEYSRPDPVPL